MVELQNSRQAYVNLALATAAFAVAFAAWSMISPLSSQIQADFKLDNTAISLLIAVPTLLGALMRIPMGILTDRFGGRKVFTGLLLFTLLPITFLSFAQLVLDLRAGRAFSRHGRRQFCGRHAVRQPLVQPDKQGTALGIYGIGNIGTASAVFSMSSLVHRFRRAAGRVLVLPRSR